MAFKLIVDNAVNFDDYEYVVEEKNLNEPKTFFIRGPYMMAESANRNNRIYSLDEMVTEARRYRVDMIDQARAVGELNHPTSADVNLERVCHRVVELNQDGNVFHGKSRVLSTPVGLIVRSLIEDGVKIGMSTRGLGQLVEESSGKSRVKGFRLVAIDCVADPSFSKAFVNGLLESKQYVVNADGSYEEIYDRLDKGLKNLPRGDKDAYLKEQILKFIKAL